MRERSTSFILFLLVLTVLFGHAQDLIHSRQSSYYTFIYKISAREALGLYSSKEQSVPVNYFYDLVDSYPTDSIYKLKLSPGHYLHVRSIDNQLEYSLESISNLTMKILTNSRDMSLLFYDLRGNELSSLTPRIRTKKISYDEVSRSYKIPKTNRQGWILVEYDQQENLFPIKREINNTILARSKRRVLGTFPINHLVATLRYIPRNIRNLIKYGNVYPPGIYNRVRRLFEGKNLEGYVALSKPKFKPGDTVRIKGFFLTKRGRPIKRNLEVSLQGYHPKYYKKKLGIPESPWPGAYLFDFVLSDTLNLILDESYTVRFNDKHDNWYPSVNFMYEQYELKRNQFTLTTSTDNALNKPATLVLKGKDANNMPLYDIKVKISVYAKVVHDFYSQDLFIKDTLWTHYSQLDPTGERTISIPDSICVDASYNYEVEAIFTNTENERHSKSITLSYHSRLNPVDIRIEADSILIAHQGDSSHNGNGKYKLKVLDPAGNELEYKDIYLPYKEKLMEMASQVEVYDNSQLVKKLNVTEKDDQLGVMASRTKDSLSLDVYNPRKIRFRYQLFRNNTIIREGTDETFGIKKAARPNQRYYLSIQYMWGGHSEVKDYNLTYSKKDLRIDIDHPLTAFPGETVDININVSDAMDKPVSRVDLTAYAITKNFGDQNINVPTFESIKSRKLFNTFEERDRSIHGVKEKLNYHFWRSRLGLDSISYYHFLYPDGGIYIHSADVDDHITQIAPYVVKEGQVVPVVYIYFNRELKFYSGVTDFVPYSFQTDTVITNIQLRLLDQMITIPNVSPVFGKKLILSLDLDNLPDSIASERMLSLNTEEKNRIASHFMWITRDNSQRLAYFQQGLHIHLLSGLANFYGSNFELVGPFFPGVVNYHSFFSIPFRFKPNMIYQFEPTLIDRETSTINLTSHINPIFRRNSLRDSVLTEAAAKSYWKSLERPSNVGFSKFSSIEDSSKVKGSLILKIKLDHNKTAYATFAMNLDQPDKYFIFPGMALEINELPPGTYEVAIVFNDESYLRTKSIYVTPYGRTFHDATNMELQSADLFSKEVINKIKRWSSSRSYVVRERRMDMQNLRQYYYQEATREINFYGGKWVSGRVLAAEDGSPLPGVNVIVKGTTVGTVTNFNGEYELYTPQSAILVFAFIGLQSQEISVGQRQFIDISMAADVQQLSEVVVTAMGVSRELRAVGYSVTTLSGSIPGISVNKAVGGISIRGVSSFNSEAEPLVIIDGVLHKLSEIDEQKITAMEILKPDRAVALYGARASNGVILISTQKGITNAELLQTKFPGDDQLFAMPGTTVGSSLRQNFRDDAFWQPRLRTNYAGEAKFNATLPDDITAWKIYVMGSGPRKRTGTTTSTIQSYKPLLGQLGIPHFLIQGDTAIAIGKITNYTQDSLLLHKSIQVEGQHELDESIQVKNLAIDSISMVGLSDTLQITYQIQYKNYKDGEQRKVVVLPKGTKESNGLFIALPKDTTFSIQIDSAMGAIKLYAQTDLIDVVLDEIKGLKLYPYECNEQVASKLKALLVEKKIFELNNNDKAFNDKYIERAIRKLVSNQNTQGGWSWWESSENSSGWITLHVAEALDKAMAAGYKVNYDKIGLRNFLMKVRFHSHEQELKIYSYLAAKGEKVQVPYIPDSVLVKNSMRANYLKLLKNQLMQLVGDSVNWKWIDSIKNKTLKGNWYWGEDKPSQWNNTIDNTLIVYQLMERRDRHDPYLIRLRNYFLEKRKLSWINTYQSSRIVEVLLPSILQEQAAITKPTLEVTGDRSISVTKFPFEAHYDGVKVLTVTKKGTSPIYFTAFQETWNANPSRVQGDFVITTQWVGDPGTLIAGTPYNLKVMVDVKKDADYVMINVPIPAGCSYSTRDQSRSNGEVYREYDIHEARIYCENLPAGKYEYTIQLLPRYVGSFTLNPAKAEWMYFPTIYGRESLKKTAIK